MTTPQNDEPYPYEIGNKLAIQSHIPPPALDKRLLGRPPNLDMSLSPLQLCLDNPPREGKNGSGSAIIELKRTLYVREDGRSRLFIARCVENTNSSNLPANQDLVVKIYDPRYRDFYDHPFLGTDYDYTHECAAYKQLSELQGSVIPIFFGSFTLSIKAQNKVRLVRLIVIEHIDGTSMDQLYPGDFTTAERQQIMTQIVDGKSLIYAHHVFHGDFEPRNVVVVELRGPPQVRIIDLGKSDVTSSSSIPEDVVSPLLRWKAAFRHQVPFDYWIDWDWDTWLEHQYGHTRDTITAAQKERWRIPSCLLRP